MRFRFDAMKTAVTAIAFVLSAQSYAADCIEGYCIGDWVIDTDNTIGQLVAFPDVSTGRYQSGQAIYDRALIALRVEVPEFSGLKPGQYAIDSDNSVGVITHVFQDGRASYRLGSSIYVSSDLSKEVGSHPLYQKGVVYATNSYSIGKAIRFFENKQVQLERMGGGTTVGTELFTEVDQLDGYRAGSKVVSSQSRDVTLMSVFANGAVTYRLSAPANATERGRVFDGKIYAFFVEQSPQRLAVLQKGEERSWLVEVARKVAKQDNLSSWGLPWTGAYLSVTAPENLPELQKALLERLAEEPQIIGDERLREKVREILSY